MEVNLQMVRNVSVPGNKWTSHMEEYENAQCLECM